MSSLSSSARYPEPPLDLSAPAGLSWTFTVLCLLFLGLALAYCGWLARRGQVLGLLMLLGGLLAAFFEAYADYVGLLWFAADNAAVAINVMGRHIPLYVVVGYSFFFGLQAFLDYRAIRLGMGRRYFVASAAFAWVFDFALQATGASFGLYRYFSNDPFKLFGAPVWWFTIDCVAPALTALLVFGLRHRTGWGTLLPILAVPAVYAGWNGAAGLPIFLALNSNYVPSVNGNGSPAAVWAGGVLTIALCVLGAVLAWSEIGRAQRRAGIAIRDRFSFRELLFADLPRDRAAAEPVPSAG